MSAGSSRRDFLRTSGVLLVGLGSLPLADVQALGLDGAFAQGATGPGPYPDPDFRQLRAWIAIHTDGRTTFYVGKTDLGQGTGTAFRQIMADELDVAFEHTSVVMGRTDLTVDQGGSGGSDALQVDGWPMRRVAAEARRVLLDMAASRLGAPVEALTVRDGVVSVSADPSRQLTYGALMAGRAFDVPLRGDTVDEVRGEAPLKPVQALRYVGTSPARDDIPRKVDGTAQWAVDVRLPGMVHARNVKPPVAGATLVRVDESSISSLPGFVAVRQKGNYLAVVFEREEQAIRGARQLQAEWRPPASRPFPASDDLFRYIREATPSSSARPVVVGEPEAAFARPDVRVIEADYEIPFQGHTAFAPAHALADPSNHQLTIYSNDMKSYGMRNGVAKFLGMPRDRVRVLWMDGPQGYGRTAADDAGFEAAWLATELGRPVRMQWMRQEEQAWDTKGPAFAVRLRGAVDAVGQLVALDYDARAVDQNHVGYNEPDSVLIAQLMGVRRTPAEGRAGLPGEVYAIPHRRMRSHVVGLPMLFETPLRTGNLRDPNGPQITFAAESFIDELAAAAKADPMSFRLRLLEAGTTDDSAFRRVRSIAVLKAAAEAYGWEPRPAAGPRTSGDLLVGRGVAYAYRNQTVAAVIAEVEVHRTTGHVRVRRFVCAHDCGLVVNPEGLRGTIECGLLYSLSRALHEEVRFDTEKVLATDWRSLPTLTHADTPDRIDVVLVNGDPNPARPDLPPYGAGETMCKPVLAAVGNAIFDATGVRLRRVPFRDARVQAALRAAGV